MNKKPAFSLIEAMIILILISIAIMAMIPLISQQTVFSRWKAIKNDDGTIKGLTYGNTPYERIGIGGVNPYYVDTADPANSTEGKFVVRNLAIHNNENNSIVWGDQFSSGTSTYTTPNVNHSNSIVLGVNSCSDAATNSIIMRSTGIVAACPNKTNSIDIDTSLDTNIANQGARILVPSAAANPPSVGIGLRNAAGKRIIDLNGLDFDINFPDGNTALKYTNTSQILSIGAPLYVGYGDADHDGILDPATITLAPTAATLGLTADGEDENTCSSFVRDDLGVVDPHTYCQSALQEGTSHYWITSDRRLKNIISDYDKGIDELSQIDTYKFAYKGDKKQKLNIGIIAQKLKGLFDELIRVDVKGFLSYERDGLMYAMVNSIKSIFNNQNDIIDNQKELNKKADKYIRMYK